MDNYDYLPNPPINTRTHIELANGSFVKRQKLSFIPESTLPRQSQRVLYVGWEGDINSGWYSVSQGKFLDSYGRDAGLVISWCPIPA